MDEQQPQAHLSATLPAFATELRQFLIEQGEPELAAHVQQLATELGVCNPELFVS
jgi:hypothetical protein